MEPLIARAAAGVLDPLEAGRAILQGHPLLQPHLNLIGDLSAHPYGVFPFNLPRGVHQPVGQAAIIGKQE
jgi:hypothetical protein